MFKTRCKKVTLGCAKPKELTDFSSRHEKRRGYTVTDRGNVDGLPWDQVNTTNCLCFGQMFSCLQNYLQINTF